MDIAIKQLKQGKLVFFPQTSSESVLLHDSNNEKVLTLDNILNKKVIVNKTVYTQLNEDSEVLLNLGDDFELNNNELKLRWNDVTT